MTDVWYGIAWLFEQMFKVLPYIGKSVDVIFISLLAFGCVYWIIYEYNVRKGGKNYLSNRKP